MNRRRRYTRPATADPQVHGRAHLNKGCYNHFRELDVLCLYKETKINYTTLENKSWKDTACSAQLFHLQTTFLIVKFLRPYFLVLFYVTAAFERCPKFLRGVTDSLIISPI